MRRLARAACLIALVASGCDEGPAAARDPSVAITELELPPLRLEDRAGGPVPLADAASPVTLLYFWATWCGPCRRGLPQLIELSAGAEGVRLIAVTDEAWEPVRVYFGPGGIPRQVARDPTGGLARTLGVASLPDAYVLDASGVARRRIPGAVDWSEPAVQAWVRGLPGEAAR